MKSLKPLLYNLRVIILLIFIVMALFAIHPNPFARGAAIRGVASNSSASLAGIKNPPPLSAPMSREVILSINNIRVNGEADYYTIEEGLPPNITVEMVTNKGKYLLTTRPIYNASGAVIGTQRLGLSVYDAPKSNIRKGLDLEGGTRVVLMPEQPLDAESFDMLIANLKQRLNLFGVSDISVRKATDLSGNSFVLVEIAGAKKDEVRELLGRQGKFEAKVGNQSVFLGGNDITYVCRSPDCSGIDPHKGCSQISGGGWVCRFRFTISLSQEAAQRQAAATANLSVVQEGGEAYLSQDLYLYLDDNLVDTLRIGAELKGRPTTDVMISGSGRGATQLEARDDAIFNMKRLQTVLITGSLPTRLIVSQMSSISPTLGHDFLANALFIGAFSLLAVLLMVFIRYRSLKISLTIIFILLAELFILFGFAALIGWNMDIASIAGLIIVIGTSVDDQIVITDDIRRGEKGTGGMKAFSLHQMVKRAFFIIMGAYFTLMVAMLPLMRAGAGLLKGFAVTTILGASIGVLISRPAFSAIMEYLLKE